MGDATDIPLLQRLRATPELFDAIRQSSGSELSLQQSLRSQFDENLVRAALSVADARAKAHGLLPESEELWLTRVGLEQATAWDVARHKARRFPVGEQVLDLCCGIGCDTAALAERGPVTAVDFDPAMLQRCRWNLEIWNPSAEVQTIAADVRSLNIAGFLVHLDPDRRSGRDRPVKRLEQ